LGCAFVSTGAVELAKCLIWWIYLLGWMYLIRWQVLGEKKTRRSGPPWVSKGCQYLVKWQTVDSRFCKPKARGSNPLTGTTLRKIKDLRTPLGGLSEPLPRVILNFFHSFQLILQVHMVVYLVGLIAQMS
jgi:hypothetical protein